jgi:hypothetical protein
LFILNYFVIFILTSDKPYESLAKLFGMPDENNKPRDIIDKLKLHPPPDLGRYDHIAGGDCPACGAKEAKQPGLTHCAYCGYEFIKPEKRK